MSFVVSQSDLDKYYALGVRKFVGARMMGVMYHTRPEIAQRLLPPPLEPAAAPGALIFIAEYPETNLGPGYREAALYLQCQYKGEAGTYCLSMPIDNQPRMHNGRDIFGLPKKLCEIGFSREGATALGWVKRDGVVFCELTIDLSGSLPQMPPQTPTFVFKAMPRIDLQPGFDGPVLLCRQQTTVEPRSIEIGMPALTLRASRSDPWHEVEAAQVLMGFYIETDNTMNPGEVIGEVDGKAFLPYYFKMTDFSAGTP